MNPAICIWASWFADRGPWPNQTNYSWEDSSHPMSFTQSRYRGRQ